MRPRNLLAVILTVTSLTAAKSFADAPQKDERRFYMLTRNAKAFRKQELEFLFRELESADSRGDAWQFAGAATMLSAFRPTLSECGGKLPRLLLRRLDWMPARYHPDDASATPKWFTYYPSAVALSRIGFQATEDVADVIANQELGERQFRLAAATLFECCRASVFRADEARELAIWRLDRAKLHCSSESTQSQRLSRAVTFVKGYVPGAVGSHDVLPSFKIVHELGTARRGQEFARHIHATLPTGVRDATVRFLSDPGEIPDGLRLHEDGELRGVPTMAGSYVLTIRVQVSTATLPDIAINTRRFHLTVE